MDDMKEGFLCPICLSDLGDVVQLQVHFEEKHSKEDPVFLQNLKDLFGRAKKKILNTSNEDDFASSVFASLTSEVKAAVLNVSSQESKILSSGIEVDPVSGLHRNLDHSLGVSKTPTLVADHTDMFRTERRKKTERNKSASQILVRLEKLLTNLPSEPAQRRAHEQSVVPWISEDTVKLCPNCARSFNLARRRHHCRLCGGIVCADCCDAVTLQFARKVVNPATIANYQPLPETSNGASAPDDTRHSPAAKLTRFMSKKFGSHESLNTLVNSVIDKASDEQFRTCRLCKDILEQENRRVELVTTAPIIVKYYDGLQSLMTEGRTTSEAYLQMADSISKGEDDFSLAEARTLRVRLLKIAENVDIISKRIAELNTDPGCPEQAFGLELKFQQRIRMAAVNYVKETLVGLPSVPSEEEFQRLKAKRIEDAERRVQQERLAAKAAKAKYEKSRTLAANTSPIKGDVSTPKSSKTVDFGTGLVLSSGADLTVSSDPLVQQIQNLRYYIQEARRLGKFDEVASLEENLSDLQLEYKRTQKDLEENYTHFKGIFHKTSPTGGAPNNHPAVSPQEQAQADEYDVSGKNPFF